MTSLRLILTVLAFRKEDSSSHRDKLQVDSSNSSRAVSKEDSSSPRDKAQVDSSNNRSSKARRKPQAAARRKHQALHESPDVPRLAYAE